MTALAALSAGGETLPGAKPRNCHTILLADMLHFGNIITVLVRRWRVITCIRDVRKAKMLTLQDVAERCIPPTTPQTIGRLETGTRTVSVAWLNRIAAALDVTASDLVKLPRRNDLPVVACLRLTGAHAPRGTAVVLPPLPGPGQIAIIVEGAVGDYHAGDEIWCDRIAPEGLDALVGREILVPQPAGRFQFGRLLAKDEGGVLLAPQVGTRQEKHIANPAWVALPVKLVRSLG
jgi:transcriptional regulator with XRE-family HTH domain